VVSVLNNTPISSSSSRKIPHQYHIGQLITSL
jgi:hypothetical protein